MKNSEYLVLVAMLVAALLVLSAVIGIRLSATEKNAQQMLKQVERQVNESETYY